MKTPENRKDVASRFAARDVLGRVKRAWGESPFYQARLKGPAPDRLLYQPNDPWAPDKDLAQSLIRGRLTLGGEAIDCAGELGRIWDMVAPDGPLNAYLQEFSWLRHLEALSEQGKQTARVLVEGWLDRYEKWSPEAWEPYFVAERLVQLCSHHPLVLSGGDALWRSRVLSLMARQTRHLARTAPQANTGFDRLMTSLGLCIAGYCLPGCEDPAECGLEMTRRELRLQLRPDGGHVSRNPSRQLKLAVRLQAVQNVIEARGLQPPGFLRHTVMRASAMASFFRCPDGRLAVFNGGYEDDGCAMLAIQEGIDSETVPTSFARHSGYHKLTAGRALVIIDTGDDSGSESVNSTSSFHFSSGRSRVIVNCGNGGHRASRWRKALEKRAAHSALSFECADSAMPVFGEISHRRAEEAKGQLLEFTRTLGYAQSGNSSYSRRIFLAAGGDNLRGEEALSGLTTNILVSAVWRFHLHPSVRASLARDRQSVILLLDNKEGWRFKTNCPALALEKSVYCGAGDAPASTEQIVLRASSYAAASETGMLVRWALQRLDRV